MTSITTRRHRPITPRGDANGPQPALTMALLGASLLLVLLLVAIAVRGSDSRNAQAAGDAGQAAGAPPEQPVGVLGGQPQGSPAANQSPSPSSSASNPQAGHTPATSDSATATSQPSQAAASPTAATKSRVKAATPKPTAKPTPKPTPKPVPPPPAGTNLALGVWSGQPWEPGNLSAVTSLLGRAPNLFLTYQGWDRAFHASDESEIARRGAQHILTWEPNGFTLKSIANGSHDAFIQSFAKGAAAWGGRIYLRPMHEMNGSWYSWGRGVNGNTAADFVNAWRHMHDIFKAQGASNVKWVWSPNVRYGPEYPLADLYPGSSYVDWVALDGYNWGSDPHLGQPAWQSFEDIFGATYREITQRVAPGKPMIIAETASTENGGNKAQWILKTFLNDVPKYPAVRAVIWFNQADGPSNFRINSSASSLAAFKQVLNSGAYRGRLP